MQFKRIILIIFCILLMTGCATKVAQKAYSVQDMYRIGEGHYAASEYEKAIIWFRQTAEQGHVAAQNKLAWMLYFGVGCEKDLNEARHWYQQAANHGDADAQNNLGILHEKGEGGKRDLEMAVAWYAKSAEQGNSTAQFNLGLSYLYGMGVKKDVEQARDWLQEAADNGHERAGEILRTLDRATQTEQQPLDKSKYSGQPADDDSPLKRAQTAPTPQEMYRKGVACYQTNDYKTARYWYEQSALHGNASAQNNLGAMLANAEGGKRDPKKALVWYIKSAKQGNSTAQLNLGLSYLYGQGIKKNIEQARQWIQKAADNGHEKAREILPSINQRAQSQQKISRHSGTGRNPGSLDRQTKLKQKKSPISERSSEEIFTEGLKHLNGKGVPQNYKKALALFSKAAKEQYPAAQYYLGMMYEQGLGTSRDLISACVWYARAAKKGDSMASERYNALEKQLTPEQRQKVSRF